MIRIARPSLRLAAKFCRFGFGCAIGMATFGVAFGETWTDSTGKFRIEATFKGIESDGVLLLKEDGVTIKVPLSKLNATSKAQALRLARSSDQATSRATTRGSQRNRTTEADRSAAGKGVGRQSSVARKDSGVSRTRNFSSSGAYVPEPLSSTIVPPAIGKLPVADPPGTSLSLEQAYEHVVKQVQAGDLLGLYLYLPSGLRETLDDPDVCQSFLKQSTTLSNSQEFYDLQAKLVEVLVNKKKFVLGAALLKQVPPAIRNDITRMYDPGAGLVHEVVHASVSSSDIAEVGFSKYCEYCLPRIGFHLSEFIRRLPKGVVDKYLAKVVVNQRDASSGSITFPDIMNGSVGEPVVVEFVNFEGYWYPKEFADRWMELKDDTKKKFLEADEQIFKDRNSNQELPAELKQASAIYEKTLDGLLRAQNQNEFDTQLQSVMMMFAPLMMGG